MNEGLIKKLRLASGSRALVLQAPDVQYISELGLQPDAGRYDEQFAGTYDFVLLFVQSVEELNRFGSEALKAVKKDGLLWIGYPKGTSKVKTDINRDRGWDTVKQEGFEGVASIANDETWSALRFRPADQTSRRSGSRDGSPAGVKQARAVNLSDPGALEVPDDLASALSSASDAAAFFDKLAPYGRKEYICWVKDAKREETRTKRIAASIEKLQQGIKAPHLKS
jgi:hypothetical protein